MHHGRRDTAHRHALYVPIPTSNIRLLCLTYTFSPFIRLIRLFWKKWRRKGKVRATVIGGKNTVYTPHVDAAPATQHAERAGHRRQGRITHWFGIWFYFFKIFYLCLGLCILLLVRLPASRKSGKYSLTIQCTLSGRPRPPWSLTHKIRGTKVPHSVSLWCRPGQVAHRACQADFSER